jgi:outer membrane receptor protein involved in Fe transport
MRAVLADAAAPGQVLLIVSLGLSGSRQASFCATADAEARVGRSISFKSSETDLPEQTESSRHLRALRAWLRHSLILAGLWGGHAAAQDVIQEVIVTAQKTAQPASKTPLALSVPGGDDLRQAGATNPVALTELAPNVQITTDTGMLQVAIRGVVSLGSGVCFPAAARPYHIFGKPHERNRIVV